MVVFAELRLEESWLHESDILNALYCPLHQIYQGVTEKENEPYCLLIVFISLYVSV